MSETDRRLFERLLWGTRGRPYHTDERDPAVEEPAGDRPTLARVPRDQAAKAYAHQTVTPLYTHGEIPTAYERGMLEMCEEAFLAGVAAYDALAADLAQLKALRTAAESDAKQAEAERDALAQQLQQAQAKATDYLEEGRCMALQVEELQEQLQHTTARLNQELGLLQIHTEYVEAELQQVKADLGEWQERAESLDTERDVLLGELQQVKLDHQETRGAVAAWKQKCDGLELRRVQLETANNEIAEEIGRLAEQLQQAQTERDDIRRCLDDLILKRQTTAEIALADCQADRAQDARVWAAIRAGLERERDALKAELDTVRIIEGK